MRKVLRNQKGKTITRIFSGMWFKLANFKEIYVEMKIERENALRIEIGDTNVSTTIAYQQTENNNFEQTDNLLLWHSNSCLIYVGNSSWWFARFAWYVRFNEWERKYYSHHTPSTLIFQQMNCHHTNLCCCDR